MREHALVRRGPSRLLPHDLSLHDIAMGAVLVPAVVLSLLPFVSIPTDHETVMRVKFSDGRPNGEQRFSLTAFESVCAEIKLLIADPGPAVGAYTKIKC